MTDLSAADEFHEQKAVTIHDVAKKAGVSIATVSRVLNGAPTVDPVLAERVHAAAVHLKYQPSRAARILAGRSSVLIGLLVTDMQNPFFLDLIRGVEEVLQQQGYLLVVCNTLEDEQKEAQYLEVLAAEPVAGVIVVPTQGRIAGLDELRERNIPVIAVDRRLDDRSTDCVLIDNVAAAREAVAHLIANGYRRIGMIGGPKSVTNANERVQGYRQALQDAGIPQEAVLEQRGSMIMPDAAIRLTNKLLNLDPPVDAIFTANNRLTMGTLRAIHARKLRIPADVALVGFDELYWSLPELVSVTSVIQSAYEIGSTAATRLIQRLQKPDAPRQEIILRHQLAVRNSSRPRAHPSDNLPDSLTLQTGASRGKEAQGSQFQEVSPEG